MYCIKTSWDGDRLTSLFEIVNRLVDCRQGGTEGPSRPNLYGRLSPRILSTSPAMIYPRLRLPFRMLRRQSLSTLTQAQARYAHYLERYPLVTKSITSGLILLGGDEFFFSSLLCIDPWLIIGDIACQTLITKEKLNYERALKFSLLGSFYIGPALHYWYGFLVKTFPRTSVTQVIQRVATDQFLFTPLMLSSFLSAILTLDGKSNEIASKLKSDFIPTLMVNYTVWIPAMFINFKFVPNAYQVLDIITSVAFELFSLGALL